MNITHILLNKFAALFVYVDMLTELGDVKSNSLELYNKARYSVKRGLLQTTMVPTCEG